jgi:hypothetical protein
MSWSGSVVFDWLACLFFMERYPNTERRSWQNITEADATSEELHLVRMIMGERPKCITPEQWRENMRGCAKSIRGHVAVANVSLGRAPALTRRDWSRIRAALWAYRCAEMNDRRGYDRVEHAEIFEASAKREREILRTLTKCKHRPLPNQARAIEALANRLKK